MSLKSQVFDLLRRTEQQLADEYIPSAQIIGVVLRCNLYISNETWARIMYDYLTHLQSCGSDIGPLHLVYELLNIMD